MSILIKGMKMPNKCEECLFFNVDFGGCGVTNNFILRKWGKGKPDWCPLVEIVMPNIVRCKDCKYKDTDKCPLAEICNWEWVTWSNADD